MKVSDAIANHLVKKGVKTIFGYQGGSITHMIESFNQAGIQYIQNYNEQGSAIAADAYSRIKQEGFGVAIGTNGPGATNMITGIADAYCDSVPVLYFTGQVHTFAMKQSRKVRQESFQEIDIISMIKPITKYAVTVMDKDKVIDHVEKAIYIATHGRPGPVVIDLPVDVQGQDTTCIEPDVHTVRAPGEDSSLSLVPQILNKLLASERPIILAGGGIRVAGAISVFRKFVDNMSIPVVTSLMGLDCLDHSEKDFIGMIGSYGNRYANLAIQRADTILVVGSRIDMRQTGKRKDLFATDAFVIHVDIDENELAHFIKEDISVNMDIKQFFESANEYLYYHENLPGTGFSGWKKQIDRWKDLYPSENEQISTRNNPNLIMKILGEQLGGNCIITADVGQNQLWLAQSLRITGGNVRILNSGGLGAMGFSLPAAIGSYYANPDAAIIAIMGDGGFQMNIQELQLISNLRLPIIIMVMNNHALGLIREVHEKYYNRHYVGSVVGFSTPNLAGLAEVYNFGYKKVVKADDLVGFNTVLCEGRPYIIEVELSGETYVRPELLGNDGLDHQTPYIKEEEKY